MSIRGDGLCLGATLILGDKVARANGWKPPQMATVTKTLYKVSTATRPLPGFSVGILTQTCLTVIHRTVKKMSLRFYLFPSIPTNNSGSQVCNQNTGLENCPLTAERARGFRGLLLPLHSACPRPRVLGCASCPFSLPLTHNVGGSRAGLAPGMPRMMGHRTS